MSIGMNPRVFMRGDSRRARISRRRKPSAVRILTRVLNGMSQSATIALVHRTRSGDAANGATRVRPILINNWEATYFDFNEDKIIDHRHAAQESWASSCSCSTTAGSASANIDNCSLGDWVVNTQKAAVNGLDGVCAKRFTRWA